MLGTDVKEIEIFAFGYHDPSWDRDFITGFALQWFEAGKSQGMRTIELVPPITLETTDLFAVQSMPAVIKDEWAERVKTGGELSLENILNEVGIGGIGSLRYWRVKQVDPYMSPETKESVERGIEQSKAGQTKSLGDFSQYAEPDDMPKRADDDPATYRDIEGVYESLRRITRDFDKRVGKLEGLKECSECLGDGTVADIDDRTICTCTACKGKGVL